ncbi:MAG: hypothetical protein R3C14_52735 [Caldilineaceae bacterium]
MILFSLKQRYGLRITQILYALALGLGVWGLASVAPLFAQEAAPTPIPTAPPETLVVVAGGHGATLWDDATDTVVATVEPGARLVADQQSSNHQWYHVVSAEGAQGWAAADELIIFARFALPAVSVQITPATPTPAATATPAPTATTATEVASTAGATGAASAGATTAASTTAKAAMPATAPLLQSDAEAQGVVNLTSSRLNVRAAPANTAAIIAKAAPQQTVAVLAQNADASWLAIAVPDVAGGFGWVAAQYIDLAATAETLPVADLTNTQASSPVVAAAPAVAQGAAPAAVQQTSATGLQGKLVFQTSYGGAIYLYNLGNGQLRQLTHGFDPALSPDGSQVAFTRGGGENGVYLINVDGSNERKIFAERELLFGPKWSPDGQWIVFERRDDSSPCYLVPVDEDSTRCVSPLFLPPNPEALYPVDKDRIPRLAIIDVNGQNYRDVGTLDNARVPDWNSSGIVYQSNAGLQITSATANDQNHLLFFQIRKQYHQDPDWQPGGGRIVFQQREGSHWEIYGINADGGGLAGLTRPVTTLVDQLPSNVAPAWSPDGQHIVFLSNRTDDHNAGPWRLWVMNADGGAPHPLPVNLTFNYTYVDEQMVDWSR